MQDASITLANLLKKPGASIGPMAVGCGNEVAPSSSEYLSLFSESLLSYPDWHPFRSRGAIGPGGLRLAPGYACVKT